MPGPPPAAAATPRARGLGGNGPGPRALAGKGGEAGEERAQADCRSQSARGARGHQGGNSGRGVGSGGARLPGGRRGAARADFAGVYEGHAGDDGSLAFPGEYLVILGRKK